MAIRGEAADMAAFLNTLLDADQSFVERLISHRLPCNEAIANHPSVQVGNKGAGYEAGILGVLNGFFGVFDNGPRRGWGALMAVYEGERLVRFAIMSEPSQGEFRPATE